jgi:hypothetical protein
LILLELEWPPWVDVPAFLVLLNILFESEITVAKICSGSSQSQRKAFESFC